LQKLAGYWRRNARKHFFSEAVIGKLCNVARQSGLLCMTKRRCPDWKIVARGGIIPVIVCNRPKHSNLAVPSALGRRERF
jgi:ribosomal protein L36